MAVRTLAIGSTNRAPQRERQADNAHAAHQVAFNPAFQAFTTHL
jgi:hypothetical protein